MCYKVVWEKGLGDYYNGRYAKLCKGEATIWEGYSDDTVTDILRAVGILFEEKEEN